MFLLAGGVSEILNVVAMTFSMGLGFSPWGGVPTDLETTIAYLIQFGLVGSVLKTLGGAYLLFGGGLLANLVIPSNRPYCPECGHELRGMGGVNCPECGVRLPADVLPAHEPVDASETATSEERPPAANPFVRRFVPLNNRKALIGYYAAIASIIPVLGVLVGPVAVAYGIEGLRSAKRHPQHGGAAHAWTAVVLGGSMTVLNLCGLCVWPALLLRQPSAW